MLDPQQSGTSWLRVHVVCARAACTFAGELTYMSDTGCTYLGKHHFERTIQTQQLLLELQLEVNLLLHLGNDVVDQWRLTEYCAVHV